MKQQKPSRLVSGFVKLTGLLPAWLYLKPAVYYAPGAPKKLPKPSILMSNHQSLMDFVLYLCVFPFHSIRFLMAEVLFRKGPAFAWFLFKLGGIYVDRDIYDFGFVGTALETLDAGGIVGVFPQGRLPVKGMTIPFKPSVTYIALHTDSPIIPVYTDGVYHPFKRARVMVGAPIYLRELCPQEAPDPEKLQALTTYLEQQVAALGVLLEQRKQEK